MTAITGQNLKALRVDQIGVGTSVVVPEDVQWRKFERILETASRVWGATTTLS